MPYHLRAFFCWAVSAVFSVAAAAPQPAAWRPLFNGKDLKGWETFISRPQPMWDVPGLARDASGNYAENIGVNRDPLKVFTFSEVDGGPAMRVSGQGFGVIATLDSFSNYHLRLQVKWGEKKWEPRLQAVRDSGLLYHAFGEQGSLDRHWLPSVEFQIQEHDMGDLFALGTQITVPVRRLPSPTGKGTLHVYDPAGEPLDFKQERPIGNRAVRAADHEKPYGEWNTLELIVIGADSIHIVNGQVVMRLRNARRKDESGAWTEPLTKGRIALQTEGAEVFYRDVEIRSITEIPAAFAEKREREPDLDRCLTICTLTTSCVPGTV